MNRAVAARLEPFLGLLGPWGVTDKRSFALVCRRFVLWCWCHSRRADADATDLPREEAAHRPRSNGALLNQAYTRCLPPIRRRSRHRLRRRRPRGALRIRLTAGDPDVAVRVSAACDLGTAQTALFARPLPARARNRV